MTPAVRRLALTAHVAVSVGWIGAALAYLVLVVGAMRSADSSVLRAAWIAMQLVGWYAIVPLALASLLSGLVMSLGTPWGLFRHYWVLLSLGLTAVATAVLIRHMITVSAVIRSATDTFPAATDPLRAGLPSELMHAGVGLLVLLTIEALNIFKPLGLTAYGRRTWVRDGAPARSAARPAPPVTLLPTTRPRRWGPVLGYHAVAAVVIMLILHLLNGGLRHT